MCIIYLIMSFFSSILLFYYCHFVPTCTHCISVHPGRGITAVLLLLRFLPFFSSCWEFFLVTFFPVHKTDLTFTPNRYHLRGDYCHQAVSEWVCKMQLSLADNDILQFILPWLTWFKISFAVLQSEEAMAWRCLVSLAPWHSPELC